MNWIFIKSAARGMADYGSISARIRSNGMNRKYAVGFRISQREWGMILAHSYPQDAAMESIDMTYAQFDDLLSTLKARIEDNAQSPSLIPAIIRELKTHIPKSDRNSRPQSGMLLTEYMTQYRDDMKEGRRLKRNKAVRLSDGYIGNITSALSHLHRYEAHIHRRVRLDQVDMDFQRSFVAFLISEGLSPNTIRTRMNTIRGAMKAAFLDHLTLREDFRHPDFVPSPEESDSVWLTPEQIEQLRTIDLSTTQAISAHCRKAGIGKKRMAQLPRIDMKLVRYIGFARDIFVAGCLTGQRYSDYTRLSKDMLVTIDGSEFLSLRQQKTGRKVLIPLDTRVAEILNRYDGRLPVVSKLTYSRHIKLLAELLGWTHIPEFDRPKSNRQQRRFCDMVTTHTCRRSFATNAYASGVPLSSIMAVTGHTSEKNLRRYLKLQAEDKAVIAARDFEGFILMAPTQPEGETSPMPLNQTNHRWTISL